jgi:hypothetical protein
LHLFFDLFILLLLLPVIELTPLILNFLIRFEELLVVSDIIFFLFNCVNLYINGSSKYNFLLLSLSLFFFGFIIPFLSFGILFVKLVLLIIGMLLISEK